MPCTNVTGRHAVLLQFLYMEDIMANSKTVSLVAAISDKIAAAAGAKIKAETLGGSLALQMSALFAECDSDEAFAEVFGNGINGKDHVAGLLRDAVETKIAKCTAKTKDAVRNMLRVRMSEARKLRRLGGMPQKDELIQAALKRYQKPATKDAKPGGNESSKVSIAADASMDDIADALSVWVAKHGSASAGLVAKLADFLPVSVKRTRKAA